MLTAVNKCRHHHNYNDQLQLKGKNDVVGYSSSLELCNPFGIKTNISIYSTIE